MHVYIYPLISAPFDASNMLTHCDLLLTPHIHSQAGVSIEHYATLVVTIGRPHMENVREGVGNDSGSSVYPPADHYSFSYRA